MSPNQRDSLVIALICAFIMSLLAGMCLAALWLGYRTNTALAGAVFAVITLTINAFCIGHFLSKDDVL